MPHVLRHRTLPNSIQYLTAGGPSVTPEFPSGVAGRMIRRLNLHNSSSWYRTKVGLKIKCSITVSGRPPIAPSVKICWKTLSCELLQL
jgi:hypothetical protein